MQNGDFFCLNHSRIFSRWSEQISTESPTTYAWSWPSWVQACKRSWSTPNWTSSGGKQGTSGGGWGLPAISASVGLLWIHVRNLFIWLGEISWFFCRRKRGVSVIPKLAAQKNLGHPNLNGGEGGSRNFGLNSKDTRFFMILPLKGCIWQFYEMKTQ